MSCYYHVTPGRLRVKAPLIRQNAHEAQKVDELLRSIPGVQRVCINGLTGSVTILHRGSESDARKILSLLKDNGYLELSEEVEHPTDSIWSRLGATAGKMVLGAVVEKALEGSMLSLLALLVG